MTISLRTLFLSAALSVSVAGCQSATTSWQHPSIPQDQWSADAAQCRHEAMREAEERLAESASHYETDTDQDLTINQMMAQDKTADRARPYFRACMTALGYQPVEQ